MKILLLLGAACSALMTVTPTTSSPRSGQEPPPQRALAQELVLLDVQRGTAITDVAPPATPAPTDEFDTVVARSFRWAVR